MDKPAPAPAKVKKIMSQAEADALSVTMKKTRRVNHALAKGGSVNVVTWLDGTIGLIEPAGRELTPAERAECEKILAAS